MNTGKILVLGATGQVGRHLARRFPDWTYWTRAELDLAQLYDISDTIAAFAPSIVINTAAYTDVESAETHTETAWTINACAPAQLAVACEKLGAALIQVSTDYVFDGEKHSPYLPSDPVSPLGSYGRSKLAGELAVESLCRRHWILRTSWVFSQFNKNFVKTVIRLAREGNELRIVEDQVGTPTYAGAIADAIGLLAQGQAVDYGIHHYAGVEAMSWYEFASNIIDVAIELGKAPNGTRVIPIPAKDFATKAPRPAYSALATNDALSAATSTRSGLEEDLRDTLKDL